MQCPRSQQDNPPQARFVLLLSKAARESDEVYAKVAGALELGMPIVPPTLGPIELHGWYRDKLGGIQQIACSEDITKDGPFPKVVSALRRAPRMRSSHNSASKDTR